MLLSRGKALSLPFFSAAQVVHIFYPFLLSGPGLLMDSQRILKPRGVTPLVVISAIDVLFSDHPKCLDFNFMN